MESNDKERIPKMQIKAIVSLHKMCSANGWMDGWVDKWMNGWLDG